MKMTVLYVRSTGHVLAAVTRAAAVAPGPEPAPGEAAADVLALVGPGLPVRSLLGGVLGEARVPVPALDLAVVDADLDERMLQSPRSYAVDAEGVLGVIASTTPPVPTISVDDTRIQLALAAPVVDEVAMQLHLVSRDGGDAQHFVGSFKPATPTAQSISFRPSSLLGGEWFVLTLVQGYRAEIRAIGP